MPITMSHHAPIQRHIPMTEAEQAAAGGARAKARADVPWPFETAAEMLAT